MKMLLLPLIVAASFAAEKHIQTVALSGNETDAQLLEIASNVVASPRQLAYHKEEFIGFIHFGPNTFTGREWGNGMEDAKVFAPEVVDTDQWCRVMKDAGMTKVIITVKHHDGYCTWQTRYNDAFSVHQSPWKDGKGDVLRQLADSCRKFDLRLGVYLSPADLFQIESPDGLYGNESKPRPSVIPTDPASLQSDPLKPRARTEGKPAFQHELDDYNRYFMNQLYELLTEYGPVHEVWFDGAHPKRKGGQTYRKDLWFSMIRQLAPDAVIFGGPDVRWCGNEHGGTRANEWNILPIGDMNLSGLDRTPQDIGSDARILARNYEVYGKKQTAKFLNYMVSEVDTSIRNGWFWRNEHEQNVRSADEIFDIYERSVGGNAVFLLNVPPATDGKLGPRDVACMTEVGRRVRSTYGTDLAQGFRTTAKGVDGSDLDSYWQPEGIKGSFEITLSEPRTINRIALQEAIGKVGQRVKSHALDAWIDDKWVEISSAGVIGYKRIHRFDEVTTSRLRVRILDSRNTPSIATLTAHYYAAPPQAVSITRAPDGRISLTTPRPGPAIHYTLDGSQPDAGSPRFTDPFDLPEGGTVQATSIVGDQSGPVSEATFGLRPQGWKITASSEHAGYEATKAIDGDTATFWHSSWAAGHPAHPIALTIELPETTAIRGFTYLPRQDRRVPDSMVEAWRIETSPDGREWTKLEEGEFGNLLNDPSQRTHLFDEPGRTRWFRFVSLRGAQGKPYAGAAEIELLGK
ncbi:alpha-L-fucosidase [Haloferula rosea]|uniref:alpha-L-fucosidase n=1 Tax=Haloferula rosea TaxID=490093 RepID=A0A934REN0_9BACT|nr:alpha-L-fucosidase [Haloferula rosea]MBK1828147.1 alpha-L-fucosidase [Haloferula rosea]